MAKKIKRGKLVLVKSTENLKKVIEKSRKVMASSGKTVAEFHGKLVLTASDETDGLCFIKKFTMNGWREVYMEIGKPGTGQVPFPAAALDVVDLELFCSNCLEDVVLIRQKVWMEEKFGRGMTKNPSKYKHLKELFKFHGKVLRVDWAATEKQPKGFHVLRKFTLKGWEPIYVKENDPKSGFLLFPQEILKEFDSDIFFSEFSGC